MSKQFTSAQDFRQSLEQRLQNVAKQTGEDLERIRRAIAFNRFLGRLFHRKPYPWILKGGYALDSVVKI